MNERGIERDRGWKDGGVSWTTSNRLVPEIFYSAGTEVETEIEWSSEQPDGSSFYLLQFNARSLMCPWAISGITEVILRLISCQCENKGVFLMQHSSYFNARDPKRGGKAPSARERQVIN